MSLGLHHRQRRLARHRRLGRDIGGELQVPGWRSRHLGRVDPCQRVKYCIDDRNPGIDLAASIGDDNCNALRHGQGFEPVLCFYRTVFVSDRLQFPRVLKLQCFRGYTDGVEQAVSLFRSQLTVAQDG